MRMPLPRAATVWDQVHLPRGVVQTIAGASCEAQHRRAPWSAITAASTDLGVPPRQERLAAGAPCPNSAGMDTNPTVGELFKASAITDDDMLAAVDAYMADAGTGAFPLGGSYSLDLNAAVRAHPCALKMLGEAETDHGRRRSLVLIAILSAQPERL